MLISSVIYAIPTTIQVKIIFFKRHDKNINIFTLYTNSVLWNYILFMVPRYYNIKISNNKSVFTVLLSI